MGSWCDTIASVEITREPNDALGYKEFCPDFEYWGSANQRIAHGGHIYSGASMKTGLRICAALEMDPFENGKVLFAGIENKGQKSQMNA